MLPPSYPFTPRLSRWVTRLPSAVLEIALQGCLSLQFIEILHSVTTNELTAGIALANHYLLLAVLDCPTIHVTERLLATALLAYNTYFVRRRSNLGTAVMDHYLHIQVRSIRFGRNTFTCDQDVLAWTCLVLHAMTRRHSEVSEWATRVLATLDLTETKKVTLRRAFPHILWIEKQDGISEDT